MDQEPTPIVNLPRGTELSVKDVMQYISKYGQELRPSYPPVKPKGGSVYLLYLDGTVKMSKSEIAS